MKALVTGGAGFIGSNLVKTLLQQGDDVVVLDNLSSGYQKNIIPFLSRVHFVKGDIRDNHLVDKLMEGVDVVYHLAASVGNKRSIDNPFLDADINIRGTLCILEAARLHHIKKITIASSAGIFGELITLPIKENHPVEPRTPYACSKLYAEKIALSYADLYGIEAVCLRYFNVYGSNQRLDPYGNAIPIFVFKMLQDQPLTIYGDGEQTRDFVNVQDIVQANIKSASVPGLIGAFNIASGVQVTINQLIRELILILDKQPVIQYQDPRPGDVRHSLADISAAKKTFGYCPEVNLVDGLKEYIAWAKSELKESIL